ncbi:hypothetical protein D3C86_1400860 [compost metagenome]
MILPMAELLPWAPPIDTWYHSLPSLSTPSTPMLPTWWWPHALMQPEMFSEISPRSCTKSRLSKRSWIPSAIGIDLAFASEQKSPPGQAMMSVSRPILAVARPACFASCQRANRSCFFTSGSTRFCSCATRSSPNP